MDELNSGQQEDKPTTTLELDVPIGATKLTIVLRRDGSVRSYNFTDSKPEKPDQLREQLDKLVADATVRSPDWTMTVNQGYIAAHLEALLATEYDRGADSAYQKVIDELYKLGKTTNDNSLAAIAGLVATLKPKGEVK